MWTTSGSFSRLRYDDCTLRRFGLAGRDRLGYGRHMIEVGTIAAEGRLRQQLEEFQQQLEDFPDQRGEILLDIAHLHRELGDLVPPRRSCAN